ncbi:unnamed protein product [Cylindrotheca closterium]|uniref:Transcription initiation factor TFIID subunit 5 n=1 Tax=Cylindrotheca closterium TaxID=2856 RepID=A0AAD2G315_9STRA|nr:unnamed protein product [Cylindrotheca closterium]
MSGVPPPASSQTPQPPPDNNNSNNGGSANAPGGAPQAQATEASAGSPSLKSLLPPSDQAVLDYLKAKGMGTAMLELEAKLSKEHSDKTTSVDPNNPQAVEQNNMAELKKKLEHEEDIHRTSQMMLHKSTGGGFGYDRDAAAPIVQWGIPNNTTTEESPQKRTKKNIAAHLGEKEAEAYLDSFTALQLWVLTLPDDPHGSNLQPLTHDPIAKARELIAKNGDKTIGLSSMIKGMATPNTQRPKDNPYFQLPPSSKPELLSVTFALLVHTYCELLEVGMDATAHVLRDTFGCVYEPIFGEELKDLNVITTTADIVRLNAQNQEYLESLNEIKRIYVRIAECQLKIEKMRAFQFPLSTQQDPNKLAQAEKTRTDSMARYQNEINLYQEKHKEKTLKASSYFNRMSDLQFLRRARGVRWQLTLSAASYGLLVTFLNNTSANPALLAMSTLLQTKCEIHVEQRDPLPITPAIIFDEESDRAKDFRKTALVNWAAPSQSRLSSKESRRPFPKYHLEEEYDDARSARKDKQAVEFNRALLVNGFRRLEALERKRGFQTMKKSSAGSKVSANPLEPSILLSTLSANNSHAKSEATNPASAPPMPPAGPPKRNNSTSSSTSNRIPMTAAMWEEAGIGLTCAKLCPPDGRRVAVGCDDAAIRIWDLADLGSDGMAGDAAQVLLGHKNGFPVFDVSWNRDGRSLLSAGGDGTIRLWDTMVQGPYGNLSTNNDPAGPTSTTVTAAKKPAENKNAISSALKEDLEKATKNLEQAKETPQMTVPGLKPESNLVPSSGAALAVYRHAAQKPIWSTAFAPCGYYFASAGADATARLWTTDRVAPVRLFCGHTANSVNTVVFHPNCNYILTGSDDRTARLWDIQTGKCVRLLNGCSSGIYQVQIDPSGQYAVGSDISGSLHLWDLGTSKKITEFRPPAGMRNDNASSTSKKSQFSQHQRNMAMCHSLSFSACGTALASGGDDRCVRIWDIQKAVAAEEPIVNVPAASFATRRTMLMDLHYTKRNLLLSVGRYINQ